VNTKNKKIIKLTETEDGYLKVKLYKNTFHLIKSDISKIDYAQAEYLGIILHFSNTYYAIGKSYVAQTQYTYHKINKK
jgi:hypothetical protein